MRDAGPAFGHVSSVVQSLAFGSAPLPEQVISTMRVSSP